MTDLLDILFSYRDLNVCESFTQFLHYVLIISILSMLVILTSMKSIFDLAISLRYIDGKSDPDNDKYSMKMLYI